MRIRQKNRKWKYGPDWDCVVTTTCFWYHEHHQNVESRRRIQPGIHDPARLYSAVRRRSFAASRQDCALLSARECNRGGGTLRVAADANSTTSHRSSHGGGESALE